LADGGAGRGSEVDRLTWVSCEVFAPTRGNWFLILSLFLFVFIFVLWHAYSFLGLILFVQRHSTPELATASSSIAPFISYLADGHRVYFLWAPARGWNERARIRRGVALYVDLLVEYVEVDWRA
jgi:hypothetical protein